MKKKLIFLLAAVIFIGGCMLNTAQQPSQSDTMMESEDESMMEKEGESMMDEDVVEFVVEGSEFKFEPANLTVSEGSKVRITFRNVGQASHDWRLDEFGASTQIISAGSEETVEFMADQVGEFEYYCSVGTHRQMGMVGTITVE